VKLIENKSSYNDMSDKIEKSDQEWQESLTAEQYRVTRQQGTEAPFTGLYLDNKNLGIYKCICCGSKLFQSTSKFDSGSGWPSFTEPYVDDNGETNIATSKDSSHGMIRTEVHCKICGAHLGHLFTDGPRESTGLRYCINSVSLNFEEGSNPETEIGGKINFKI
jgi:peptide-methionine (R)-S-oxide reductase